jgi:uncharacterized heparinase superfamily protein
VVEVLVSGDRGFVRYHMHDVITKVDKLEKMARENAEAYARLMARLDEFFAKEKAPTPVKESRPECSHATCGYEVGGRWDCEY